MSRHPKSTHTHKKCCGFIEKQIKYFVPAKPQFCAIYNKFTICFVHPSSAHSKFYCPYNPILFAFALPPHTNRYRYFRELNSLRWWTTTSRKRKKKRSSNNNTNNDRHCYFEMLMNVFAKLNRFEFLFKCSVSSIVHIPLQWMNECEHEIFGYFGQWKPENLSQCVISCQNIPFHDSYTNSTVRENEKRHKFNKFEKHHMNDVFGLNFNKSIRFHSKRFQNVCGRMAIFLFNKEDIFECELSLSQNIYPRYNLRGSANI